MSTAKASEQPVSGEVARFPADRVTDARLVEAAAHGDRAAIATVWDRYARTVRGVLLAALGPDPVIDDLLQEVFLAFVRGAKSISDGRLLRSYLAGVAVRLAALEIRKRKVRRWVRLSRTGELPDPPILPEDFEARQALSALYRVLDKIGNRPRLAFVLRDVQGLEMLETAAALRISESTLRRELARAREQVLRAATREPALAEFLARARKAER